MRSAPGWHDSTKNRAGSGTVGRWRWSSTILGPTSQSAAFTGRTSLGLLFIDLFFIPADLRRDGLGGRLLQLAEDEARRRGCVNAVLYTINFQAPGFYERHGYRILGSVPCLPPGTSRIFMTKPLR